MTDPSPSLPQSQPTSPLAIADYRQFWLARFLAVFSTLSMVVLIGYQTYDVARADYGMSIPTASLMLGFLGLAQFVPLALLTPVAGVAADIFDRRRVVLFANCIDAAIALVIGWATWADALNLPLLFTLAAAHGAARVFNNPALSAIAPNIVPPRLLPRAIAMSSIAWQIGTVAGPAAGGLLFDWSPSFPYFLSAALLVVSGVLISTIRPVKAKQEGPPRHPFKQVADGFRFIRHERFLLGCITLDLFAVLLGNAVAMLPVFARDILEVGPEGLGFMRGAPAAGAAIVAGLMSVRPLEQNVGEKMLWSVAAFGALTVAFALSTNFLLSLVLLALLGAADMVSVFIRSSLVQLNTPDDKRGRVSAISGLAISASNELGELRAGVTAVFMGAVGAVVFGGVGAVVVTGLWAWLFPELRRARTFSSKYLHDDETDQKTGEEART